VAGPGSWGTVGRFSKQRGGRTGAGEIDRRPFHPLISHVAVPPLAPAAVRDLDTNAEAPALIAALADLRAAGP
jgi:hypothetical protein